METAKLNSRECSVRLRRSDGVHDYGPPRTEISADAANYNKGPLVSVKVECDAGDGVVSQESGAELKQPLEDIDLVKFLEGCPVMKTENELDEMVLVKEELDIGPTVLQERAPLWPTSPQTRKSSCRTYSRIKIPHAGSDSRLSCGTEGGAPLAPRATAVPRTEAVDHYRGRKARGASKLGPLPPARTNGDRGVVAPEQCRAGVDRVAHYLINHICVHTGNKLYKSKLCGCNASQISIVKQHHDMRTHSGHKPYKCKLCEYSASYSSCLKKHMRTHTGEKPYKCRLCGYSASQISHLRVHIRTHTGDKPYKCKLCEYSASCSSSLKKHMHTHTGDKPYKCKVCEYSTSYLNSLKTHVRTHTGDKPYKCKLCKYNASQIGHLRVHMHTHIGVKPYQCKLCEYSASQTGHLKVHMRSHADDRS